MTANVNSWLLKFINPWFFGKDFLKKEIKLLARKSKCSFTCTINLKEDAQKIP